MRSLALSGLIMVSLSAADGYGYGGTPAIQPFLGVEMSPPSTQIQEREGLAPNQGVQVQSVFKGTSADKAGISPGDVIRRLRDIPEDHLHCSILAVSTLYRAIADYLISGRPDLGVRDEGKRA